MSVHRPAVMGAAMPQASMQELLMLSIFLVIAMLVFATLIFYGFFYKLPANKEVNCRNWIKK